MSIEGTDQRADDNQSKEHVGNLSESESSLFEFSIPSLKWWQWVVIIMFIIGTKGQPSTLLTNQFWITWIISSSLIILVIWIFLSLFRLIRGLARRTQR